MYFCYMPSPVGRLTLAGDEAGLKRIDFESGEAPAGWQEDERSLREARHQLEDYFAGTRRSFDVPLLPAGTPFQQAVWQALLAIPYGETTSYGEIARRIGRPRAVRAVGAANGANPIPVIIPCHRVIGANGSLTGYGGGLPIKQRLLALERGEAGLFELAPARSEHL